MTTDHKGSQTPNAEVTPDKKLSEMSGVAPQPVDDPSQDGKDSQTPTVASTPDAQEAGATTHRTLRQDVWRQFRRHKGAVAGLVILTVVVLSAVFGPLIYPYDPFAIDVPSANQGPSLQHILGTDNLGRDVMARLLIGGRISLAVGLRRRYSVCSLEPPLVCFPGSSVGWTVL